METATSKAPADTFMEQLRADPTLVAELSDKGIVIQATQGNDVMVDFWKGSEVEIRATLKRMSTQCGTDVNFILRARG